MKIAVFGVMKRSHYCQGLKMFFCLFVCLEHKETLFLRVFCEKLNKTVLGFFGLKSWVIPLRITHEKGQKAKNRNRPFYSCGWKRGWGWPCFDTNLPALLCKSSHSYAYKYFSRTISITKQRRFVSKQGHPQPRFHP